MGEPAASAWPLNGAEEFDRRVRSLTQSSPHADALAELARLVDSQGPFGAFQAAERGVDGHGPRPEATDSEVEAFGAEFGPAPVPEADSGAPLDPAHLPAPPLQDWERAVPRHPSVSVHDPRPIEASPDVWVRDVDDADHDSVDAPVFTATREQPPGEGPSAKRTLIVLAAVVLLTAGGLGASMLIHPSTGSGVTTAAATPTIMAASGPSKVQPETTVTGDDAPSEPSKLLDKNKNDGTAEAKIISTTEQPVDLNQAIKATAPDNPDVAASPAAQPAVRGAFPEPRKVKTILVRPDGSIIPSPPPSAADPAASPAPADQQASLAFDPTRSIPSRAPDPAPTVAEVLPVDTAASPDAAVPPAAAEPAAPAPVAETPKPAGKTTTRVAISAAGTTPDAAAAAEARSAAVTPKAKPVAHVKPKPKPPAAAAAPVDASSQAPTAVADAAPTAAPDATPTANVDAGGSFAIQLGAAPTEAEGQAAAARLGQKYAADLGGAAPAVRKAQAAGKTVYRVRVGNLSQAAAKALCAKVQAGGGGCFVARN